MSPRANVYEIERISADGGISPNRYVDNITAEVRVFYPPTDGAVEAALAAVDRAYSRARATLEARA